jgi:hypothetical protein
MSQSDFSLDRRVRTRIGDPTVSRERLQIYGDWYHLNKLRAGVLGAA